MKRMNTRRWMALAAAVVAATGVTLTSQVVGQSAAAASTAPSVTITSGLSKFNLITPKSISAKCPLGMRVIGGGGRVNGAQHVVITEQRPVQGSPDTFVVSASADQLCHRLVGGAGLRGVLQPVARSGDRQRH